MTGFNSDIDKLKYINACVQALSEGKEDEEKQKYFVERHSFPDGTPEYAELKPMLLLAAKLRNTAVFYTRQHFFNKTDRNYSFDMFEHVDGKYLSYNTLYRYLYDMTDMNFFILPSTVA